MNLWNEIQSICAEPKSNSEIMESLGSQSVTYTEVCALTRIMANAKVLNKSVDQNKRRGYKYRAVSDLHIPDPSEGLQRKQSAHRKMKRKYMKELDALRAFGDRLIRKHGYCNTDMLRAANNNQIKVPKNLWGAVFSPRCYVVKNRRPSSIKSNNGRYICDWERVL